MRWEWPDALNIEWKWSGLCKLLSMGHWNTFSETLINKFGGRKREKVLSYPNYINGKLNVKGFVKTMYVVFIFKYIFCLIPFRNIHMSAINSGHLNSHSAAKCSLSSKFLLLCFIHTSFLLSSWPKGSDLVISVGVGLLSMEHIWPTKRKQLLLALPISNPCE